MTPTWIPGPVEPGTVMPQVTGSPGAVAGLPLVAEVGAFRSHLRDFLRSNGGQQSKLTARGSGVVGDPHVQTAGQRAGAIVQVVKLGGREFHIYFHKDGRREVIAMPKTPAQPTGGMLAPS